MNLNSHRNHHPQNIPIDLQHTNIKHLRQHVKKYVVSKNVSHIRDIRYSHIRDICPYKVTYINSLSDQHWIFRNWCPIRWNMNEISMLVKKNRFPILINCFTKFRYFSDFQICFKILEIFSEFESFRFFQNLLKISIFQICLNIFQNFFKISRFADFLIFHKFQIVQPIN